MGIVLYIWTGEHQHQQFNRNCKLNMCGSFLEFANQVSIGDEVLTMENNSVTAARVINVSSLIMKGNIQLSQSFYSILF